MIPKLNTTLCFGLILFLISGHSLTAQKQTSKPNIILVLTDDQGWGDIGIHGNPHIQTPTLDRLAKNSVQLTDFYVSPVCAPTRASLMTGRYSLRTGVRDTYNGGAIMAAEEYTLAEMLKDNGYSTAIFGKWHLGDNYPTRPMDQGFEESLVHLGGGIGQPGDYLNYHKGDSSYFNPVLLKNGEPTPTNGYCSDVYTDAAIDFISNNNADPFFIYLSYNAPHTPLQLPQSYYDMYKDVDPSSGFEEDLKPEMSEADKEAARKVYGMVTNIDDNIKRVMTTLNENKLADNTLVIFMTDNGPQQRRYIGGLRGKKGQVYQGGIKVPCYFHFPARFPADNTIDFPTAHIDILPTISALCGIDQPETTKVDGINLLDYCTKPDEQNQPDDRSLFFYWHRRNIALYHNMAVQKGPYKLVANGDYQGDEAAFELFNLEWDKAEKKNRATEWLDIKNELHRELDDFYYEMINEPHLTNAPAAVIGTSHENPLILNRNDAFGQEAIWAQDEVYGFWEVSNQTSGYYTLTFKFLHPLPKGGEMKIQFGSVHYTKRMNQNDATEIVMNQVYLTAVKSQFTPWYFYGRWGNFHSVLPFTVKIEKEN